MSGRALGLTLAGWLALTLASAAGRAQEPPSPPPEARADGAAEVEPQVVPPTLAGFVEAALPPDLDVAPGAYAVTLAITIDEAGAVTDARVLASDAAALDEPALEAAGRFAFTPALVDGQTVPVQITYRYTFDIRPKVRAIAAEFVLRKAGTREALAGLSAFVEETGDTFTSDAEGLLQVSNVAPGAYTLYLPEGAFRELRRAFEVQIEGAPPRATLYLRARAGVSYQTVVRAPKEVRFVARQSLEFQELRHLPGSGGDPLKMVENLPGISRPQFGSGQLVVFGSPPQDSQVFLDGLPFYQLYHFGGLYSVLNPEFIERIDFVPAGFDGSFGDAIGGIVDVRLKESPVERWKGSVDINPIHAQVYLAAPYSDKGDLQVAFRRSYIDAILKAVDPPGLGLTTAPRYYDYQVRWQHRFTDTNRLSVFWNGTDDRVAFVTERPAGSNPQFSGDAGFTTFVHSFLTRWSVEPRAGLRHDLSAQVSCQIIDLGAFDTLSFQVGQWPLLLRDVVDWRLSERLGLRAGVEGGPTWIRGDVTLPRPPGRDGEVGAPFGAREILTASTSGVIWRVSPFASLEWKPVDRWTIVPSVRADLWWGWWKGWSVDPRLSTRVALTDTVDLKAAGGLFHQIPFISHLVPEFGNPGLPPNAAAHALLGVEWRPLPLLTVGANAFFKYSYDLAEPTDDRTTVYTDQGEGRSYGADFLLRVDPGGRFFGWVAYTLVYSERYNFDAADWQYTGVDQRHLLNVLGSVDIGAGWSAGFRFRLSTGYPYTPIRGSVFDSDIDEYMPLDNPDLNSARVPAFHALDLRVDKEWVFDTWLLALYLEVQNVYNHRNPEGIQYNYDFSQQDYVYGLPILPVFGVRGEF